MNRIDSATQKIRNKKCACHRPSVFKTQQGTPRVICWQWVDYPAKPAKSEPKKNMLLTLNSLRVADLMRGPDTSRVLKIRSDQRYKKCLISAMIIELPRNALNETQHLCWFGDNRLNMAQKGYSSVQNDHKVLNILDTFKFMTSKR
jgi:hypothetical protein